MPNNANHITLTSRQAARTRIGICTDTHLYPGGQNRTGSDGNLQLLGESEQLLGALVQELEASQLDLVIHLGDFTCGGGYFHVPPENFYLAADMNRLALGELDHPVFGLPGNHDCPPGDGDWTYVEEQWQLEPGLGLTIDTEAARLILLNAQGHQPTQIAAALPDDPVYGWVNDDELARLEHALATADSRPVLLCVHQLLRPWCVEREWRDYYAVQNALEVLEIMARYGNVRAVLQGHAHMLDVHKVPVGSQACHFIIVPAIIEYPLGWLELSLTAHQLHVQLRSLPLPALLALTEQSGGGQSWRAGKVAWRDFCINLAD